ncbi:HD domain-containing protein [Cryptosporangium aurantiacum]|uniref:HD domain-containing protein n=1 Tax=Cryptosporangium aurantiacum TaxID=134849 RepID=A0A1M7MIA7_9ACTN|nr:HD domain-containing protein [Cryptosporangium aurantiacum]SHM90151.1 HD domain-containing protein [Cryptosporangium aurantiacum]
MSELIAAARDLAGELLGVGSERWCHSAGVAERAQELTGAVPADDRELLVAAAWLHDIGYAPELRETGFHPLDGADGLRAREWEPRVCALVAYHSGARFVAEDRGLLPELSRYSEEESPLTDALTYADQTVGPGGRRMTFDDRVADMLRRHGSDSPNARVHARRGPYLAAIADRVRARLGCIL